MVHLLHLLRHLPQTITEDDPGAAETILQRGRVASQIRSQDTVVPLAPHATTEVHTVTGEQLHYPQGQTLLTGLLRGEHQRSFSLQHEIGNPTAWSAVCGVVDVGKVVSAEVIDSWVVGVDLLSRVSSTTHWDDRSANYAFQGVPQKGSTIDHRLHDTIRPGTKHL